MAAPSDFDSSLKAVSTKLGVGEGLQCSADLQSVYQPQFQGALVLNGDCEITSSQSCFYRLDGHLSFQSLLVGPGAFLNGVGKFVLHFMFADCVSDLNAADIPISLTGPITVGELEILSLNATAGATVDPLTGDVTVTLKSLSSIGRFRGLNCITTLEQSACFVDADNDLIDDDKDNCLGVVNPSQIDTDGDQIGDLCDNCPFTSNPDQANSDGSGPGDACLDFCAEPYQACRSSDDCSPDTLCLGASQNPSGFGCCRGECPASQATAESSHPLALTCREAEEINSSRGVEGGCEGFSHACTPEGCCDLDFENYFPPDPLDLCAEEDEFGTCGGGSGFCTPLSYNEVCFLFSPPPAGECPNISGFDSFFFNLDCSSGGQAVCNELIGSGLYGTNLVCNGTCCAEE